VETFVLVDSHTEGVIRDKYVWAQRGHDAAVITFEHEPTPEREQAIDVAWGVLIGIRETAAHLGIILR
jgi:hypothetical protein